MAGRKRSQAKRKQPRTLQWDWLKPAVALLTLGGSLGGLSLLSNWMQDAESWPVRSVQVEGELRHLDSERLQRQVAPLAAAGFFAFDVVDIQRELEQLAWVERVSVRRVWPDALRVEVSEQRPVARWGEEGFLNARAERFVPQPAPAITALVRLDGPQGHESNVLRMYGQLRRLLTPLAVDIASLELDERRSWRVVLENGVDIEIGRSDPLQRIARLVRVYPAIVAGGRAGVATVDLRYSNGVAVRWQALPEQNADAG